MNQQQKENEQNRLLRLRTSTLSYMYKYLSYLSTDIQFYADYYLVVSIWVPVLLYQTKQYMRLLYWIKFAIQAKKVETTITKPSGGFFYSQLTKPTIECDGPNERARMIRGLYPFDDNHVINNKEKPLLPLNPTSSVDVSNLENIKTTIILRSGGQDSTTYALLLVLYLLTHLTMYDQECAMKYAIKHLSDQYNITHPIQNIIQKFAVHQEYDPLLYKQSLYSELIRYMKILEQYNNTILLNLLMNDDKPDNEKQQQQQWQSNGRFKSMFENVINNTRFNGTIPNWIFIVKTEYIPIMHLQNLWMQMQDERRTTPSHFSTTYWNHY